MYHKNYNLSREIFEQLSSMTDDGFIVVDRDGNVIHINEKYCNFLGTTEEEALGNSDIYFRERSRKGCHSQ